MEFNSFAYALFLPVVFLLYWNLRSDRRKVLLVLASCGFYGAWSFVFLGLMLLTGGVNWLAALGMCKVRHPRRLLWAVLGFNFGILGVFKYYNFFAESLMALLEQVGVSASLPMLQVLLPVGISFYTFQVSSYVVDVYQRKQVAVRDGWLFFAFLSFFPQLVAGPIERSEHLLPQLERTARFDYVQAASGLRLILWGLMKKMLLADNCGHVVNQIFHDYATCTPLELWAGALFFAFQIYGDFSGYTDMAIGSARLFGIELTRNFRLPYFSASIPEFWRNWHISLMAWFRSYVYIPLGGNREGRWKKWRNVFAVFLLSGLWHGAGWTYVVWGLYHALLFVPYSFLPAERGRTVVGRAVQTAVTFMLVCVGWVIFRSASMAQAGHYLQGMFGAGDWTGYGYSRFPLLLVGGFVLAEYWGRGDNPLDFRCGGVLRSKAVRMSVYFLLFLITLWWGGAPVQFIYFQF